MPQTSWLNPTSWSFKRRICAIVYLKRAAAIFLPKAPKIDQKALFMLMRDAFSMPCQQTESPITIGSTSAYPSVLIEK